MMTPDPRWGAGETGGGDRVPPRADFRDGCGLCVPSCAEGAIAIVDGKARLVSEVYCDGLGACLGECPQGAITLDEREAPDFDEKAVERRLARPGALTSRLGQWPVQLHLVPPNAPYFEDAELLVAADCVPFAYAGFHEDFLDGRAVVVGCPKLDDISAYVEKLTSIFRSSSIKGVKVLNMEVPCCFGLVRAVQRAIEASGREIPFEVVTIGVRGEVID